MRNETRHIHQCQVEYSDDGFQPHYHLSTINTGQRHQMQSADIVVICIN